MTSQTSTTNFRSSNPSTASVPSMNFSKTLQVQDQIIQQLRADQTTLKDALEAERAALKECRITTDRELKSYQREILQLNKVNRQQEMKIEELERELSYAKEALAFEQKNFKNYEKEQVATVKDLKMKMIKDFDKINKQEMLIDQLKSEVEDLKEALNSERNATNLLIREHNAEVKMLREEVKAKSTETYRELKERATREREEYREMQEEAEKTYKVLEKDFREALAAKDEELRKVKAEAKLIQKELEDQLRNSLKEPNIIQSSPPVGCTNCVEMTKFRRLKNELTILKQQNRTLLNEIQALTEGNKPNELTPAEPYVIPYENTPSNKNFDEKGKKSLTCLQDKTGDFEITRMPSDYSFHKNIPKRQAKSNMSIRKDEGFRPYPKTKTEERYEELKRTMMILRKALQ